MNILKTNLVSILTIISLILLVVVFNIPFKEKDYIFDWDQANDYSATASISQGKLTLIGPRVTSDQGFFLGPWHYYFLLPFYLLTGKSLYMGFWAALFVQILFTMVSFIIAKKWFGIVAGICVGLFVATAPPLVEWGFMYVPLLSLLFFYFCLKTIKQPKLLPLLFLFFGFSCTVYTVFYALCIPLAYIVIYLFINQKTSIKNIVLGILLFLVPYTPLFVFDIRHDFLNFKNIIGFFTSPSGQGNQFGYFIAVFFRALNFSWLNHELNFIVIPITVLILICGSIYLFKKNTIFVFFWLISSLVPMAFYKGNVSEYYYAPVILLIPFFTSGLLEKGGFVGRCTLIALTLIIIIFRLNTKINYQSEVNLSAKINVVNQLEKLNTKYSVSYELPLGQDSGYSTIFKTLGQNFVPDGSSPLYTITNSTTTLSGAKIITTSKLGVYKR